MLVGADRPENLDRQAGKYSNRDMIHTKRVNKEIVLDLVYVPRVWLF